MATKIKVYLPRDLPKLPEGWSWKALGELVHQERGICYGIVQPGKHDQNGIPMVNSGDILTGTTDIEFKVATGIHKKFKRSTLQGGEVLLTLVGANFGEAAIAPDAYKGFNCARPVGVIPVTFDPEFVVIALQSSLVRHYLDCWANTTAQPTFNLSDVPNLPIAWPPETERFKIKNQIGALDKKIELNRQANQTLEQMAQALFKSWFVDFDPVIDNALAAGNPIPDELQEHAQRRQQQLAKPDHKHLPDDIRQLFPSEFELTEALGWVPKGWKAKSLDSIANGLSGYAFKSKDFSESGEAVIKIKNIKSDRSVDVMDVNRVSSQIASTAARFLLSDGDIVMAMTGATVGKFGVVVAEDREAYFVNQRVCKLSSKSKNGDVFLYAALNKPGVEEGIVDSAQGSAQPNISATAILSTSMVVPTDKLIDFFIERMGSTYARRISLKKQEFKLTKLRDTLLPKLISGELRLPSEALAGAVQQPANAIV